MAFKAVNLKDFSGGLNTAVDESLLPINQTADMMNMDILDTGALTVRHGWQTIVQGPVASPIRKLSVFNKTDGTKYWVVGAGNKVWGIDTSGGVPRTKLEGESFHGITNATVVTPAWDYHVSGGQVSRASGSSGAYAIPSCNKIEVWGPFGTVGASLKVDAGSWVTATQDHYTFDGLSVAAHNIYVKPAARNTSSWSFAGSSTGNRIGYAYDIVSPTDEEYEAVTYFDFAFSFYDTGTGPSDEQLGLVMCNIGSASYRAFIGFCGTAADALYGDNGHYTFVWDSDSYHQHSTIAVSTGWHQANIRIKCYVDGFYYKWVPVKWSIDTESHTLSGLTAITPLGSPLYPGAYSRYMGTGNPTHYFDTYRKNGGLTHDCGNYTGYSTYDYLNCSFGTSTYLKDTATIVDIDKFYYEYVPTWNTIVATTTSNDLYGFAQLNNKMWVAVSGTRLRSWDGSTVGTITGTCYSGFLIEKDRRLWGAGDWVSPDRSYLGCTVVDEPNNWSGIGAETFHLQGRDTDYWGCTGLGVWDKKILYTGEHCLYGFDVSNIAATGWVSEAVSQSHGCVAPQTFTTFPRGIIFLSADGVRAFGYIENVSSSDGSGLMMLSKNINNLLDGMDATALKHACSAFFENKYYISLPLYGADHNTHILVCDLEKRTKDNQPVWTIYNIPNVTALLVSNHDGYKLYAGLSTGDIAELMTGTDDDGSAINAYYDVPPVTVGGYDTVKHYKRLNVSAQADAETNMTVTPTTDDVYAPAQNVTIDQSTDTTPNMVKVSSRGHYLKLKLQASATAGLTVNSVTVMVSPAIRVK